MAEDNNDLLIDMGVSSTTPSIIKVIGVGGGGGNAVNHMYREGIHDVNFVVCNTDSKALADSPVPVRLQIGKEGLGAGNRPACAREAAEESVDQIKQMLDDGTKWCLLLLVWAVVQVRGQLLLLRAKLSQWVYWPWASLPFPFVWREQKIDQALDGVEEISKHVDALLVINNERLREIYPELNVLSAFEKADNTLSVAARSIAEIITMHGIINLDFRDVCTVLKDGGVAIMSTGYGEGENRVSKAIEAALHSPLLNNNDIFNSKKVLLSISFCAEKEGDTLMMDEMNEVHEFMSKFHDDVETKWGLSTDPSLGKQVKITILATGFGISSVPGIKTKLDAEAEQRRQIEIERDEENAERRDNYYGVDKKGTLRRRPRFFLFGLDDLDNEEIISLVELTPTYKRSKDALADIKAKSYSNVPIEPESIATANNATVAAPGSVISF